MVLRKSAAALPGLALGDRRSGDRAPTGGYQQGVFSLEAGDLVVLFTDGVSESMNARDEEWGEERLIEFAKTCYGLPALEGDEPNPGCRRGVRRGCSAARRHDTGGVPRSQLKAYLVFIHWRSTANRQNGYALG